MPATPPASRLQVALVMTTCLSLAVSCATLVVVIRRDARDEAATTAARERMVENMQHYRQAQKDATAKREQWQRTWDTDRSATGPVEAPDTDLETIERQVEDEKRLDGARKTTNDHPDQKATPPTDAGAEQPR